MKQRLVLVPLLLLLAAAIFPLPSRAGEPTTSEQRQDVVRVTRLLETHPFSNDAATARGTALKLIDDAPDLSIRINAALLRELLKSGVPDRQAIYGQYLLATAAFLIEHPDAENDETASTFAAFTSALQVYRQAVERDPANKIQFWDVLSDYEHDGTLKARVAQLVIERKPAAGSK